MFCRMGCWGYLLRFHRFSRVRTEKDNLALFLALFKCFLMNWNSFIFGSFLVFKEQIFFFKDRIFLLCDSTFLSWTLT